MAKEVKETNSKSSTVKASTTKNTNTEGSTVKASTTKNTNTEGTAVKATTTKKTSTATKKTTTKSSTAKATTTRKSTTSTKKTSTKSSTTKAKTTKKSSAVAKKTNVKKQTKSTTRKKKQPLIEYYDLPYRYNKTIVKLLAQTPTSLFVYWDISDTDRDNFKKNYGESFFEHTKPVLIIHNITKNYGYAVDINDFANCWYLKVPDSDCKYVIELGRRNIVKDETTPNYISISVSNKMDSPNDHILFDQLPNILEFKNIKTNSISTVEMKKILNSTEKIYNVYDLYKEIYKDENILNNIGSSM